MSNIRIRRFPSASPEGWEMDCFVLPSDKVSGELVHYQQKQTFDFRDRLEPGLFAALDVLLDRIAPEADIPKEERRMVIGRLKDQKRRYYYFLAVGTYQRTVPEAGVWSLVDGFYKKRLDERSETHVAS